MNSTRNNKPGPVEVWLSQKNMQVTCLMVHEDESTQQLDVDSLSMRGSQREITGSMIRLGYTPVGRWEEAFDNADMEGNGVETVRRFAPAK